MNSKRNNTPELEKILRVNELEEIQSLYGLRDSQQNELKRLKEGLNIFNV